MISIKALTALGIGCALWTLAEVAPAAAPVAPVPAAPAFTVSDADKHGEELARYLESFDSGWVDQYSVSELTLIDGRGDKVEREVSQMILERPGGNKSLTKFLSPADIRGVSALAHEHVNGSDDNWLYIPASRRVRRISGANRTASFEGTEFTYEDLLTLRASRYKWHFVKEEAGPGGAPIAVLQAVPNYSDTAYSKLMVHLNRGTWRNERIEYFDKAGQLLKTERFSEWEHCHERFWRAHLVEMENHQTRKRTVLRIKQLMLDLARYQKKDGSPRKNLDDSQFDKRTLEDG